MLRRITIKRICLPAIALIFFPGCIQQEKKSVLPPAPDTVSVTAGPGKITRPPAQAPKEQVSSSIETGKTLPAGVVAYAKTLIGIPYKYASADPSAGFDCSGFITYVFNHFHISVPRSSVDFTNVGNEIDREGAEPGDLVLFTGTDADLYVVGHIGIVVSNENGHLQFIHSSSGKAKGVVITDLGDYYKNRFVKVIRIFP
jgi:cell wall-associated NlpC family hydrolase